MDDKKYIDSIHRLGRIGSFISVCIMMGIPAIMCAVYDAWPSMSTVIQAGGGLLAMFVPTAASEVISYAPILGSASYITFITGNAMNLKIPVALSAQQIAGVQSNTPESDAITTMAIALSSLETIVVIAIGVLLLQPLQPILTLPVVSTATSYMVPALFGGLMLGMFKQGGKTRIKNKNLIGVLPLVVVAIMLFMIENLASYQGFVILGMIPTTILWAYILYKKGIVKQVTIDENGVEHDIE